MSAFLTFHSEGVIMTKEHETENEDMELEEEADVLGLLKRIQQQLVFLEKKIDTLLAKSSGSSVERPRFSEHRKPFRRSFNHGPREDGFRSRDQGGGFNQGRRDDRGNSFERPRGNSGRSFHRQDGGFRGKKRFGGSR